MVMVAEFKIAFCRVICIPFCLIIRFFQFSIRWVDGIRETPALMDSESLVAFITRSTKGKSAIRQKKMQITIRKIL